MKRFFATILTVLCAVIVYAQDGGGLTKQVEVTRDYTPDVEKAGKLNVEPQMVDTVSLRPEIDYSIRPTAYASGFGVAAITPARVNASTYSRLMPFYLKVGGGYPLQSLLDFYLSSVNNARGSYGAYINHDGRYAELTNDVAVKSSATDVNSRIGAYGNRLFGRLILDGELEFDHKMVDKYGQFMIQEHPLESYGSSIERQRYVTGGAKISFGDSFNDLSRFNFRVGAEAYYFSDKFNNGEFTTDVFAEFGKAFGQHVIRIKGGYAGYKGMDNLDAYNDNIITVAPRYEIKSDRFKLGIGCDFVVDQSSLYGDKSWFFPDFKMTFDVTGGYFVPFIDINGRLNNNGYRNTVAQNPYVLSGLTMENTAEYNGRAGVSGSVSSSFSYSVYAGATLYRNLNMWANFYSEGSTAEFVNLNDRVTMFTVGGDIDARISGSFMLWASAHYYGYTLKTLDKVAGRPNFDASLNVRYNYLDKFVLQAGATFIGSRHFYEMLAAEPKADNNVSMTSATLMLTKVNPVVDVNVEAEYKFSSLIGAFVSVHNLACAKLYPYNHYAGYGINFNVGVKLTF